MSITTSDLVVTVTVAEIDAATAGEFAEQLAEGIRGLERSTDQDHGAAVVVDLGQVAFLNSAGIRVLADADRVAHRRGGQVVITGARGVARRCLDICGLLERMERTAS